MYQFYQRPCLHTLITVFRIMDNLDQLQISLEVPTTEANREDPQGG